jgi:ABC-2 type transport system ATP-binding protein
MALMNRSRILFLDEPTSGLDVQSVLIIRDLIRKLNQQGLTIFLTTHNIEEASQMCDRVAIINHGKIATIDTPEKLKRTVESLQSVELAFEATPQNALKELEELPQVSEAVKQGDKFKLFTRDPSSVLASIWNYAQNNNLKLITVNTVGPSLEDVFVKLTGIKPATAEEEPEKTGHGRAQKMTVGKEQQ